MRALVLVALFPAVATADDDPCVDAVNDPVVTPVRDSQLDAQRSACMRDEHGGGLRASALIDTPAFRGELGGELNLGARTIIGKAHELSIGLTLFDYTFVQNAVNKVTHTGFGPLVLGGAAGGSIGHGARAALVMRVELPFTHERTDTFQIGAYLGGVVTGRLSTNILLHSHLAVIGRATSSLGGEATHLGLVAGTDLAWQVKRRLALAAGVDVMGGWDRSVDQVLLRAGTHWRPTGGGWRLRFGAGAPVAERIHVILDATLLVDR